MEKLEAIFQTPVLLTDNNCFEDIVQRDGMFHEILYANTFNEPLVKTLEQLEYKCLRGWFNMITGAPETVEMTSKSLLEVLAAIKQRNPLKAENKMEDHINQFISQVKKCLE